MHSCGAHQVSAELPAAVLFDMDGTITDTERYYIGAFNAMAAERGLTLSDDDGEAMVGASFESMFKTAAAAGITGDSDQLTAKLVEAVLAGIRREVTWMPGALELLRELRDAGVPTALVTMSYRAIADAVSQRIPFSAFDAVVAGDEVARGKPHPEPYERAAQLLSVDIAACIVVEDSAAGVAAGIAAGTRVVAVPSYVALPESSSYTLWPGGLAGRRLSDITALPKRGRLA